MLTFPNAKINIGLNIVERRSDGFHNIESVFYPIQWRDGLEMVKADKFDFRTTGLLIPGKAESNLILKALELVKEATEEDVFKSIVHLHKVIPMGAGMGGGSADGAFALKLANDLFELNLSTEDLQELARKLGSDCAFFVENNPMFCYDKGDQFKETTLDLSGKYIVVVNPNIHISTAEAYAGVQPRKWEMGLKRAILQPISEWRNLIKNDFEDSLLEKYPAIPKIKNDLYEMGAVYASMTGSGSTVYGIFDEKTDLQSAFEDFVVWEAEM
ncbi:MAG: 4-diphosphocytidyl-2-C-methyl-D-erythritol kinase [Spirosomataceae bacterium]|jgi:4-diphosphocytidyl-2-C-methyl-D-erythritol kinase